MEPQEIFDTVTRHLFQQGQRAMHGGSCLYRAPGGLMCAVGCLIPDELYDPAMEEQIVSAVVSLYPRLPSWFEDNLSLLNYLQSVHDSSYSWTSPSKLAYELRHVAERYDLSAAVVDECLAAAGDSFPA